MADAAREEVAAKQEPWCVRGWRAFNRWRRKYWLTRVLILLLIFGQPLLERLAHVDMLYNLVGFAIQAIQLAQEPTLEYNYYGFYKSQEVVRLRHLLLRELDADGNGRLDAEERKMAEAVGFDAVELELPDPQADLDRLAHAAQAMGLVPASYSVAEVREEAFYAARAKAAEIISREHREVQAVLDECYAWPDYGKWKTWREGLTYFTYGIVDTAASLGAGLWLLLCFLAAFGLAAQVRHRRLAGVVAGAGVSTGLYLLCVGLPESWAAVLRAFALLCSSAAVGLWAGGLAQGVRRPRRAASVCALVCGAALVFTGLAVAQGMGGYP